MSKLYWGVRDIALWQARMFHATKRMQLLKTRAEAIEYWEATDEKDRMDELADVFITLCYLAHVLKDPIAKLFIKILQQSPFWKELDTCVQRKMQINLGRKWYKTNTGEWRHVSEKAKSNV
jgi:hypothetical protein